MQFLIDACLPRDFASVLTSYGHVALDVRDIGMGRADDREVATYAQGNRLCLLTEDWGFSDIRHYPPSDHYGIVVFETPDNSVEQKVISLRLAHTGESQGSVGNARADEAGRHGKWAVLIRRPPYLDSPT